MLASGCQLGAGVILRLVDIMIERTKSDFVSWLTIIHDVIEAAFQPCAAKHVRVEKRFLQPPPLDPDNQNSGYERAATCKHSLGTCSNKIQSRKAHTQMTLDHTQ